MLSVSLVATTEIAPGASTINDPLNAPYILYVNSYTGSDKFVTGDYSTADDGTFAAKDAAHQQPAPGVRIYGEQAL